MARFLNRRLALLLVLLLFRLSLLGRFELLDELFEGCDQVLYQLELVVVHLGRQVQVRLARADPVQLDGVLVRDEGVLLPVEEKDRALGFGDKVDVAEPFIDDHRQEAGPTKQALGGITDRHVGRHEQQRVAVFPRRKVRARPATHRSPEQNDVALFDPGDLG